MYATIPFTEQQLTWHLQNNVMPSLNDATIEKIVAQCNKVNAGELSLDDEVSLNSDVTIREMLEDLHIECTC